MSILIKGVEMPKGHKASVLTLLPDGRCIDEWGDVFEAVGVPTPHGRLIDADVLAERCGKQAVDAWNRQTGTTWGYAYVEFENDVEDAPTIIEAEDNKE